MLTPTSYIVLGLLERLGAASPYDLKQAVAESVGNFWSVPHSQVYRTADQLAGAGHLVVREEATPGGRPRKLYSLTAQGAAELARWRDEPPAALPELRDPGLLKLFFGAEPRALARARLEAHRRQLSGYEARQAYDRGAEPRGPWLTLASGIGHEREWVRFWAAIAEDGRSDEDAGD
jgi:PadR family transcriptional regulator, regulatory protein AphA